MEDADIAQLRRLSKALEDLRNTGDLSKAAVELKALETLIEVRSGGKAPAKDDAMHPLVAQHLAERAAK